MPEESLRILYLCADRGISLAGSKGASVHIREFASALTMAGHQVTVMTRADGSEQREFPFRSLYLSPEQIDLSAAEEINQPADMEAGDDWDEYRRNPSIERSLEVVGMTSGFDAVYERYSLFSIAGLSYARSAGLPFILEVNAPLVVEAGRYRKLCSQRLAQDVELRLFSSADHIVAVSAPVKGYILSIAPQANVTVVPNGVDVERFAPTVIGRRENRPKFTIGFVGNLRPWHGIDNMILAFSRVIQSDPGCRLLIIGDIGKMKNEIRRLCAENGVEDTVEFTGAVPLENIPAFLREIDAAVAPYPPLPDFYFSSLKIFEYMAAAKAIVASHIGQIAEILEDGKTALLVPPGDTIALAEALTRLKRNPDLRIALGQNARIEAIARHTWTHRIRTISGIIESSRRQMEYR